MVLESAPQMLIDGVICGSHRSMPVIDPATGEVYAQAPNCSLKQLDQAVAAAGRAFLLWRIKPIEDRQTLLLQVVERIAPHIESLASCLSREQGKPLNAALEEVGAAVHWMSIQAKMSLPVVINEDTAERRSITRRVPIGVVAALAPWNFPVLLGWWKVIPALLAGNTVILKPSPMTPLTVLRMAALLADLFPAGVLNVISGDDELGPLLTGHSGVRKISFTGSTQTGRAVMRSAADTLKRLTLELGGNDAAIVLPDADPQAIAPQLFWSAFYNSGQLCIATKRLYVHRDIYDAVARSLVAYAATVKLGPGLNPESMLGPIQNQRQYEQVRGLIDECRELGHRILFQGDAPSEGYFIPVTLVDNPPDNSRVVTEEAFGPVLPLLKYDSVDEVIRRANDSPYGLAATVWGRDTDMAMRVSERLEVGTVWINEAHYLNPLAAFCGHKASGLGVENSVEGLLSYTEPQTLVLRKPSN